MVDHAEDRDDDTEVGRVVRVDNTHVEVRTDRGDQAVPLASLPADWRDDPRRRPTSGDWVRCAQVDGEPRLVEVLDRSSEIVRADALGRTDQVLAANVDVVLVVQGLDRPVRIGRLERTIALALDTGAEPVVVLTKADLQDDAMIDDTVRQVARILDGLRIVVTSVIAGVGLDALVDLLAPGRTAALLGESGAGKSSLVNAILGHEAQSTTAVRTGDAKGRHTTTTRDLYELPNGGAIIDTPGLRAVGLWEANQGIAALFADLEALADTCRFADCTHTSEPRCAVRAAVAGDDAASARVERWLGYIGELDDLDALRLERERAAERGRPGR